MLTTQKTTLTSLQLNSSYGASSRAPAGLHCSAAPQRAGGYAPPPASRSAPSPSLRGYSARRRRGVVASSMADERGISPLRFGISPARGELDIPQLRIQRGFVTVCSAAEEVAEERLCLPATRVLGLKPCIRGARALGRTPRGGTPSRRAAGRRSRRVRSAAR